MCTCPLRQTIYAVPGVCHTSMAARNLYESLGGGLMNMELASCLIRKATLFI